MKEVIRKYRKVIALLIIQCFAIISISAQTKFIDGLKIESNYHQGVIIPEFELLTHIEEDYRRSVEFSLFKETSGKNSWQQIYNYPEYGVSFFYTSLGHNEVLGQLVGADYIFRINFLNKKRFKIFNQTGFGVSYINRKYDPVENPLNTAISSHFNFHFNLRLGSTYYFTNKKALNLGLSFDHISNANLSHPNIGVNSVSLFTGITHDFGSSIEKKSFVIPPHQSKTIVEIIMELGSRHMEGPKDKYYFTPSLFAEITNKTFRFIHFGVGVDLFYDKTVNVELKAQAKDYNNDDSFLVGPHFSQTIVYDKFRFTIQEGVYLIIPEELDRKKLYNRVLFRYYLSPKISTHLSLRSYLQDLKYVSVGVGYKM